MRDRLDSLGLSALAELTHFACTSEDINHRLCPHRAAGRRARVAAEAALGHRRPHRARGPAPRRRDALAHTHGQPATPTTMGKEIGVFAWRLERVIRQLDAGEYLAKFSGATGTWSAHVAAEPDVDWPELTRSFIESLGLGFNPVTTQIESHDWQVELYDRARHAGGILHNLATDIWTYISLGYFTQIPVAGATGRRRCRTRSTRSASRTPRPTSRSRGGSSPPWHPRSSRAACSAISPTPHAAQHRRRLRSLAPRARQPAARSHRDLARRRRAARRSRHQLGSPRRGDPDRRARRDRRGALADHRPLRPAEGPHARTPRRRPRARGLRARTRHRRRREGRLLALTPAAYAGLASRVVDSL